MPLALEPRLPVCKIDGAVLAPARIVLAGQVTVQFAFSMELTANDNGDVLRSNVADNLN
jgi:hypothetical protein